MYTLSKIPEYITPSTQEMIKAKGLTRTLKKVLQEIEALQVPAPQIQKVEIEWEVDPEVEGWEMLSVTLLCHGSAEDAWSCWQELDKAMKQMRQRLPKADLDKLGKFISVGVDIE
jgi:hypothetical protein